MPAVKFFAGLDLKQKSSFLDGHYVKILFGLSYGNFLRTIMVLYGYVFRVAPEHVSWNTDTFILTCCIYFNLGKWQ